MCVCERERERERERKRERWKFVGITATAVGLFHDEINPTFTFSRYIKYKNVSSQSF